VAPTIGPAAPPKPADDWWEKSLPNAQPATKRQGGSQWVLYAALFIVVLVLVIAIR
jgi:hypothetical protein